MAGERIFQCRYAKHPSAAISGARSVMVRPGTMTRQDGGSAGATGMAGSLVTGSSLGVDVNGYEIGYVLTAATHNAAGIDDVLYARLTPSTVYKVDQGAAGSPGPAECIVTNYAIAVELYGLDYAVMNALIGDSAADLVLSYKGAAGAAKTLTLTTVYFSEITGQIEVPDKDGGGTLTAYGIRGHVHFGAAETFGDVLSGDASQFAAFLAKVGAAAANLVIGTKGSSGADEKITIKNVHFVECFGQLELAAKDAGGPLASSFGIRGVGEWGGSDTLALMITAAADA